VNLDPHRKQNSYVDVPIDEFGSMEGDVYQVHDLLSGARYTWRGRRNYVELDPEIQPAHVFRVRRWTGGDRFASQLGGSCRPPCAELAAAGSRQPGAYVGFDLRHIRGIDRAVSIDIFAEIRVGDRLACLGFSQA